MASSSVSGPGEELKVNPNQSAGATKFSIAIILALLLAFIVAFVVILGHPNPVLIGAFFLIAVIVFVWVVVLMMPTWLILRGAPLLSIDHVRIKLHSSGIAISWENVSAVRISDIPLPNNQMSRTLLVFVANGERALAQANIFSRYFAREGVRRFGVPLWVSCSSLDISSDDLCEAIERIGEVRVERP